MHPGANDAPECRESIQETETLNANVSLDFAYVTGDGDGDGGGEEGRVPPVLMMESDVGGATAPIDRPVCRPYVLVWSHAHAEMHMEDGHMPDSR